MKLEVVDHANANDVYIVILNIKVEKRCCRKMCFALPYFIHVVLTWLCGKFIKSYVQIKLQHSHNVYTEYKLYV